jgi:hypothetical protein
MSETFRVLWQNKWWIFDASRWLFYTKLVTMHGHLNINYALLLHTHKRWHHKECLTSVNKQHYYTINMSYFCRQTAVWHYTADRLQFDTILQTDCSMTLYCRQTAVWHYTADTLQYDTILQTHCSMTLYCRQTAVCTHHSRKTPNPPF